MRVALDTNRITDLFRGDLELAEQVGPAEQVWVPLLRRAGTPVPDNDLWIAALVLEHDLVLITRDRHFERIPQVIRA